jgi:hypothetical protein
LKDSLINECLSCNVRSVIITYCLDDNSPLIQVLELRMLSGISQEAINPNPIPISNQIPSVIDIISDNAHEDSIIQYTFLTSGLVLKVSPELYDGGARSSRNSGGAVELDDACSPLRSCGG